MVMALAFTVVVQPASGIAADEFWRVTPKHAQCFLDHLDDYAKSQDEPVVVFLEACPIVERLAAIQKLQKNSQIPNIKETEAGIFDDVVVFNRDEIICLKNQVVAAGMTEVLLPKTPGCEP